MTTLYRNARPQDAEAVSQVFTTSFCDTFAHLYRDEDLSAFLAGFSTAEWERQIRDPNFAFRLAEADGELVGYVKLAPLKLPVKPEGPAVLLDQLYILKEHHGTGIAHALMEWAVEESLRRAACELYLTVYIDNHRAKRFYDSYGFKPVGTYQFRVGNHADEDIIMRKIL